MRAIACWVRCVAVVAAAWCIEAHAAGAGWPGDSSAANQYGARYDPAEPHWEFDDPRDRRWSITGFIGQWDDGTFGEVLSMTSWDMKSAYIAGAALNRRFATSFDDRLHWEIEGSVYRHWGQQRHWEGNLALAARWTRFPWDHVVDTSFAFGEGVSLASRKPALEGDDTRQFLNHLLTELEFARPDGSPVSVVLRVHHRSGVWGLYGAKTGSNHMTVGLRYRF
jgi:hypothetical protein